MIRKTILITVVIAFATFLSGWFLHSIIVHSSKTKIPDDFNNTSISGHFILAQSNCAGFNFIDDTTVLWTNEIACDDPDTLRIRWLDNKIFMTKSTVKTSEHSPPNVDIYKVVSFDGKHLTIRSFATGWADSKNENLDFLEFTKQSN